MVPLSKRSARAKIEKSQARLKVISRTIEKLYFDNAEGKLSDSRLEIMVANSKKKQRPWKLSREFDSSFTRCRDSFQLREVLSAGQTVFSH